MLSLGSVQVQIESEGKGGTDIVVVRLTGQADIGSIHALITELQSRASTHRDGTLRILVDESELQPGIVGFSDIADMVHDWRTAPALRASRIAIIAANPLIRGLNQMFRLLANLERKDSLNAFTKRADAVAWLLSAATASP